MYDQPVAATILIVEDEYAVARGIQYALQQEGYEVTVARNGEEGLEIVQRQLKSRTVRAGMVEILLLIDGPVGGTRSNRRGSPRAGSSGGRRGWSRHHCGEVEFTGADQRLLVT